jgi:hypothetical protein
MGRRQNSQEFRICSIAQAQDAKPMQVPICGKGKPYSTLTLYSIAMFNISTGNLIVQWVGLPNPYIKHAVDLAQALAYGLAF